MTDTYTNYTKVQYASGDSTYLAIKKNLFVPQISTPSIFPFYGIHAGVQNYQARLRELASSPGPTLF